MGDLMIKIDQSQKSRAEIDSALKKINGLASAFALTCPEQVEFECREIEQLLRDRGCSKRGLKGTRAEYRPGGPSARSYSYNAISTRVTILRRSSAWYLVGVTREEVYPGAPESKNIWLSPEGAASIVRSATKGLFFKSAEKVQELILAES